MSTNALQAPVVHIHECSCCLLLSSTIVSSEDNINTFATNAVQFLRTNNFDGVVIDWEYPGDRGSPAADKQKYTQLLTVFHPLLLFILIPG